MSDRLFDLLAGTLAPGLYRLASKAGQTAIAAEAAQHGWLPFCLAGRSITSKAAFLQACAETMQFPGYFGHNWDALEDSLRDLAWAPARRGYLVLWDEAGVFAAAEPKEFGVALDILGSAAAFWRDTPTPMAVLLRGTGRFAGRVPRL